MSGRDDSEPLFDHMAKVNGQHVHCNRAAFFATGGVPTGLMDRMQLGMHVGFGLTIGVAVGASIIAAITKFLTVVFS